MSETVPEDGCCAEGARFRSSRRGFLAGSTAAVGGVVATSVFGGAFREVAYAATPGDTVVILNMGGGVDGLSWVVPYAESAYYRARPNIGVPQSALLATNGTFGLNPAMAPLMKMWSAGKVAMLHATGLGTPNRSHFDAAEAIGDADPGSADRRGWVNRMVGMTGVQNHLTAVGLSPGVPASMVGDQPVMTLSTLSDGAFVPGAKASDGRTKAARRRAQLSTTWGASRAPYPTAIRDAISSAGTIAQLSSARPGVTYPQSDLGSTMKDTARLIKGNVGVRVVAIDYGEFDHHVDIGAINGSFSRQISDLAGSVAAFFADLGSRGNRVTLVTTSEFGRRLQQNGSSGLDHGWGNVMMSVGAGVKGGYHASWPGLDDGHLESGDLQVTTDYRQLLADVVTRRVPEVSVSKVFPGLIRHSTGVIA